MELETILRWDGNKDIVHIFTASKPVARKIERAGYSPSRGNTRKGDWSGSFYEIPYKDIRWGVRPRQARKTGIIPPGFRPKLGIGEAQ